MKTIKNLTADQIRKSILQLAIQGKLVKQDPNDEPASELVKRIYEEKQRLIKEGKLKKDKNESYIYKGDDNCYYEKNGKEIRNITDELPFEIPESWAWVRIKDIISIQTGASFKKEQAVLAKKENYIRVLRGGNIEPFNLFLKDNDLYIPENLVPKNIILEINDLLTPSVTSVENIGKICIVNHELNNVTAGGFVFIFRPFLNLSFISEIIMYFISSPLFQSLMKDITKKSGQAFYNLSKERFANLYFPIPPERETRRILSKINQVEPLLEYYKNEENKLTNLESLFEEKLKASILQYAIEGKLVKQDPNDEPASKLLERIQEEKEKLIKDGKIKRDKHESEIVASDDKNYYEKLPASWKTISLNDVCSLISRGKTPKYSDNGKVLVLAQKCNQWDGIHLDRCLKTETSELIRYTDSYLLKVGDIVINSTGGGTVGRTGYVSNSIIKEQQVVWDTHITVVRPMLKMNSKFVYLFLISPIIQTGIEKNVKEAQTK